MKKSLKNPENNLFSTGDLGGSPNSPSQPFTFAALLGMLFQTG